MAYLTPGVTPFAHRGGAALWPENTLAAFTGALELGYRYIETDLHMTVDGHIVCFHDETLERCTDGRGRVADHSLAELKALDAGYRFTDGRDSYPYRGQGITIPTLEEALSLHPGLHLNLEIKQSSPAVEDVLWALIERLGVHDRVLIASATDRNVARFRALDARAAALPSSAGRTGILRFWLLTRTRLIGLHRPSFRALQVPARHGRLTVVDRRFVEAAHGRGLKVHMWTIDDPGEMVRLLDLGVDGVMTDRPDLLKEVLQARGQWRQP